jgi:uncharacterized protein (TIGR02145 family)
MKRLAALILALTLSALLLFGQNQAPLGFNYQAVVRSVDGQLISQQRVGVRISLLQGGASGTVAYTETFRPTTDAQGLFIIAIGKGTPTVGTFAAIDWSLPNYHLRVEVDPSGGTSFVEMGTTQLLSVPYALHAFDGVQGISAYQQWLNQDNVGTITDYITAISGTSGASGWVDAQESVSTQSRVGVGTVTPEAPLHIQASLTSPNDTLFIVRNSQGVPMLSIIDGQVVFNADVDIIITNSESKPRGGFAVSGRTSSKEQSQDLVLITPEQTNFFVDDLSQKPRGGFAVSGRTSSKDSSKVDFNPIIQITPGQFQVFTSELQGKPRGGFAVSGRTSSKEDTQNDFLSVTPSLTHIYVDYIEGKPRGGFAVSGRTSSKEQYEDILLITPELTQFFVGLEQSKPRGGFAVSGRTSSKNGFDEFQLLSVTPSLTQIFLNDTEGKPRGGFAVSGRTSSKDSYADILNVSSELTQIFVNDDDTKPRGGFAVSGRTSSKSDDIEIFTITPNLTQIYVNQSQGGKPRGGFAVSGRTSSKVEGSYDILTVTPERTDIFLSPNQSKFFPEGFSISAFDLDDDLNEIFSVSSAMGTQVANRLVVAPTLAPTNTPSSITQQTAISGGLVISDGDEGQSGITARGLVYRLSPNPNVAMTVRNPYTEGVVVDTSISGDGIGAFSLQMQFLKPGTTFNVRAFATNAQGLTGYGAVKSFTTLAPDTLRVNITNIFTGNTIPNAVISLTPTGFPHPITNPEGNYLFPVASHEYAYSIIAPGFEEATGVIYVNQNQVLNLKLIPLTTSVQFNITDTDNSPVNNALIAITLNPDSTITGYTTNGSLLLNQVPLGTWEYSVDASGFFTHTAELTTIANEPLPVSVELIPQRIVTFKVFSSADSAIIRTAIITINGVTYPAGFYSIALPSGDFSYTISRPGYIDFTGEVAVSQSITLEQLLQPDTDPFFLIALSQEGVGTITPSQAEHWVEEGQSLGFSFATTPDNYVAQVLVNGVSVDSLSRYTFNNITTDQTLHVVFQTRTYTLTYNADDWGSILGDSIQTVAHGADGFAVTAVPITGYQFYTWSDGNTHNPRTDTNVTSDTTVTAYHSIISYTITLTTTGNGVIIGDSILDHGVSYVYQIIPDGGYSILDVLVDSVRVGPVSEYPIESLSSDMAIHAVFQVNSYSITATADQNGTITPSGTFTLTHGADSIITITPNDGYIIDDVTLDGQSIKDTLVFSGNTASFILTATYNHVINALFSPDLSLGPITTNVFIEPFTADSAYGNWLFTANDASYSIESERLRYSTTDDISFILLPMGATTGDFSYKMVPGTSIENLEGMIFGRFGFKAMLGLYTKGDSIHLIYTNDIQSYSSPAFISLDSVVAHAGIDSLQLDVQVVGTNTLIINALVNGEVAITHQLDEVDPGLLHGQMFVMVDRDEPEPGPVAQPTVWTMDRVEVLYNPYIETPSFTDNFNLNTTPWFRSGTLDISAQSILIADGNLNFIHESTSDYAELSVVSPVGAVNDFTVSVIYTADATHNAAFGISRYIDNLNYIAVFIDSAEISMGYSVNGEDYLEVDATEILPSINPIKIKFSVIEDNGSLRLYTWVDDVMVLNGTIDVFYSQLAQGHIAISFWGNNGVTINAQVNNVIIEVGDPSPSLPVVETIEPWNISDSNASSGGTIIYSGAADILSAGVVWSTSSEPTVASNMGFTNDFITGQDDFTSQLTGLTPFTTYYVRTYATNSVGTGYGQVYSFSTSIITDIDGNQYPIVAIGNQMWMAKNLRTATYNNGTTITYIGNEPGVGVGAYAHLPHESIDGLNSTEEVLLAFGANYNWFAAVSENNICPTGWHVPSSSDWSELSNYIQSTGVVSEQVGNALKSCRQVNHPWEGDCDVSDHPRWASNQFEFGKNQFGFNALPAGRYMSTDLTIGSIDAEVRWWTSIEGQFGNSEVYLIDSHTGLLKAYGEEQTAGLSIRCVKSLLSVSFLVTHALTYGDPLSGATVTVDGFEPVTTDASGMATIILAQGNQTLSYTVTLMEYETRTGTVTIGTEAKSISVPMAMNDSQVIYDYEGNPYPTVTIGDQEWMAVNLRTTHYLNGNSIVRPQVQSWDTTSLGAYIPYNHTFIDGISSEVHMVAYYGLLYNHAVVTDPRGVCPTGWYVPTADDFRELINLYGGIEEAGDDLKAPRDKDVERHPGWIFRVGIIYPLVPAGLMPCPVDL